MSFRRKTDTRFRLYVWVTLTKHLSKWFEIRSITISRSCICLKYWTTCVQRGCWLLLTSRCLSLCFRGWIMLWFIRSDKETSYHFWHWFTKHLLTEACLRILSHLCFTYALSLRLLLDGVRLRFTLRLLLVLFECSLIFLNSWDTFVPAVQQQFILALDFCS